MKGNEVRVGNWVQSDGWPCQIKPSWIENIDSSACDPIEIKKGCDFIDFLGFIRDPDEDNDYMISFGRKKFKLVECQDDDMALLYQHDIGMDWSWLDFIDYAHQLQNIIYALTGEELTIKT